MSRLLTLGAPVGALLFTIAWAVLGAVSPGYRLFDLVIAPYSPISQPVSGLGLGVTGPWMNSAFVISGILVVLGAVGVSLAWPNAQLRRTVLVLTGLGGAGMILDGIFTLESVMLHLLGFLLAAPVASVGFIVAAAALRRSWSRTSVALFVLGPLALVLFAVFMVIFDPYSAGNNAGVAGLVQRVLITVVLTGQSVLGFAAFAARREPARAVTPQRDSMTLPVSGSTGADVCS